MDDSEKWKMLAQLDSFLGTYILASPDGVNWKMLYEKPSLNASDTQNVAWYDNEINEYVIFMRIDDDNPREHGGEHGDCGHYTGLENQISPDIRRIGRCTTKDLSNFHCANSGIHEAADVFSFDAVDPPCMDIYTNGATRYYNRILMFPAIYQKCVLPQKNGNDGILDVRFISSFDGGHTASYVPSEISNARKPFVRLALNRCSGKNLNYSYFPKDMPWCNDDINAVSTSTYGSGQNYFGAGYVEANNGEDLLFYYGGTTFTHAGDSRDNEHWPVSASGIGAIIVKRDRFASINGGYAFNLATVPSLRTVKMSVPSCETKDNTFSVPSYTIQL